MKEGVEDSRKGLRERVSERAEGVVLVLVLEKKKKKKKKMEVDVRELGRRRDLEGKERKKEGKSERKRAYLYPLPNWESSK